MADDLNTFNISVNGLEYLIIPGIAENDTLKSTFLIILDGVKVGTLSMNDNSIWEWSDSALLPELQNEISGAIGEAIEAREM
jgi:hypothetical protein